MKLASHSSGHTRYDVFNRRISRAVDTTSPFDLDDALIERYVRDDVNGVASLDGGNVILDFVDPDGPEGEEALELTRRYLYGNEVDQILAQENVDETISAAARVYWPLGDHLGTVRDLHANDATGLEHFQYDSFGHVTDGNDALTRYMFTSREHDGATGIQYNRARWHDASLGRWISEDPARFRARDANLARYVLNGVTNSVDPSGLYNPQFAAAQYIQRQAVPAATKYKAVALGAAQGLGQGIILVVNEVSGVAVAAYSVARVPHPFYTPPDAQLVLAFHNYAQTRVDEMVQQHNLQAAQRIAWGSVLLATSIAMSPRVTPRQVPTGQLHHIISTKISRAANREERHPSICGVFRSTRGSESFLG